MTYPDSVQFLYALGNEMKTAKLGLERIRAVLAALDNPEKAYRVVHVAGTNGKGSTSAMIAAGLQAAGVRTGLFTSPHLIEPTERIQVDGIPVSETQFSRAFDVVHQAASSLDLDAHPSYFETVAAMAFWLFRELKVQTAVIEVGLGGRLDATNVVDPVLTVITPVDLDHQIFLGDTIEQIAAEKAGILKRGVPAVFARQRPEAEGVLNARAAELGIRVRRAAEFEIRDLEMDARGSRFSGIEIPLAGEHQVDNAVAAALALEELGVSPAGIAETRWPGRLEHISPNPDIILDGAHNPAGSRALVRYLETYYSGRKRWMIFGAMRDKALNEMTQALFPKADKVILTMLDNPRAASNDELIAALPGELDQSNILRTSTVAEALAVARDLTPRSGIVCITGSLHLIGKAQELLKAASLAQVIKPD